MNQPVQDSAVKALRQKWLNIINDKENRSMAGECLLSCYQIVGATCVGLESRHYGLNNMVFDLVIIDEAGKALAGELLIPINRAKKVIIIGDHKQLPPVINTELYKNGHIAYNDVVEDEEQFDFLNRSFFQRLYEDCPEDSKCMLNVQFRMPEVIANLVNMFYDGELRTGNNCGRKVPLFCDSHLIFIDMKNEPDYKEVDKTEDQRSISPYNEKEVEAVINIVKKIRKYYDGRIVAITPYKKQRRKLIDGINTAGCSDVWVNTIDAFQGDEEDIVIYCTTRAIKPTRYFSDVARLNVAFSRSRNTLIFLGSSAYLNSYPNDHILRKVSDYLSKNAKNILYKEWIQNDFNLKFNPIKERQNSEDSVTANTPIALPIPTDFFKKIVKHTTPVKPLCKCCQKELNEGENILCGKCLTRNEKHKCKCCGGDIYFPLYNKYICGDTAPDLCEKCSIVSCTECGTRFYIQNASKERILSKGSDLLCNICKKRLFRISYIHLCDICRDEIKLTYKQERELKRRGAKLPTLCRDCQKRENELIEIGKCVVCHNPVLKPRKWLRCHDIQDCVMHESCAEEVYEYRYCRECGDEFKITYGEKKYFEQKGYKLPKRCSKCRKA